METNTFLENSAPVSSDPGVPYEHSREPEAPPVIKDDKPADKGPTERELSLQRERDEANRSAEFFRRQAEKNTAPPAAEEEEEEVAPITFTVQGAKLTTEQLLDKFSTEGLKALKDEGVLTSDQLIDVLAAQHKAILATVDEKIAKARDEQSFDSQMATEFPELAKDDAAISAWKNGGGIGAKPEPSDLYRKTGEIYRELITDAKVKHDSPAGQALLRSAAKQARAYLGDTMKGPTSGEERRSRIDAQRGERGGGGHQEENGSGKSTQQTRQQAAVASALSRFVSNSDIAKFAGTGKGDIVHDRK